MSTFFSKLFALFLSQIEKMWYLHCAVKFQLRKLGCALTWYKNAVPQLQNPNPQLQNPNPQLRCASTKSKSCAALQKLKKLNCAFCAVF